MSSTPWSKASFITKKGRLRLVVQTEKLRSRDPRATTTYISFFPLSLLTLSKTKMGKKCWLEKTYNLHTLWKSSWFSLGEKNLSFSSSTNFQFTILEQFLKFKTCKFVEIDAIGIEVAKQIKMSGCPIKGHFTSKNVYLPLLAVKWPYQFGFHMRYRFFSAL